MAEQKQENQEVIHKWSFNMKYDEENAKIVFTVNDSITEKTWVLEQTKSDYPNDEIDKVYDKVSLYLII